MEIVRMSLRSALLCRRRADRRRPLPADSPDRHARLRQPGAMTTSAMDRVGQAGRRLLGLRQRRLAKQHPDCRPTAPSPVSIRSSTTRSSERSARSSRTSPPTPSRLDARRSRSATITPAGWTRRRSRRAAPRRSSPTSRAIAAVQSRGQLLELVRRARLCGAGRTSASSPIRRRSDAHMSLSPARRRSGMPSRDYYLLDRRQI